MVVVLFVITLAAGLSLGYVNDLTLEPKAKAKLAKMVKALYVVLPQYTNNPVQEVNRFKPEGARDSLEIYPAFKDSVFVGAAVTGASEKGYSGVVKLIVGFLPDGKIRNITVLGQKETPGLGTKMKSEKFLRQFRGKNPSTFNLNVAKDGGDVDALAGATISTRAFSEATQQAYDTFVEHRETITNPDN